MQENDTQVPPPPKKKYLTHKKAKYYFRLLNPAVFNLQTMESTYSFETILFLKNSKKPLNLATCFGRVLHWDVTVVIVSTSTLMVLLQQPQRANIVN